MNIDSEMRAALRRETPSSARHARIMDAIRRAEAPRRQSALGAVAAAALLVTMLGGAGFVVVEERERREGEKAKQQLLLALRITSEKTNLVKNALTDERN